MGRNVDACITKMNRIANFWLLLNPSLPGRINLAKTYLFPQIAYPCSIVQPTQKQLDEMEDIIFKFVKQREIVSRSKIFSDKKSGGLGLPLPIIYLQSLDILLFKKGLHIQDTWTHELFFHCNNNDRYYFIKKPDISCNPISHRIVSNYIIFANNFWIKFGNILDLRVFQNNNFVNNFGQKLSINFLSQEHKDNPAICAFFKKLRFKDLLGANYTPLVNREAYNTKFGFVLTQNEHRNIDAIVFQNYNKYRTKIEGKNYEISTLLNLPNIKSKNFRKFFIDKDIDVSNIETISNRYLWTGVNNVDIPRELNFQKCWSTNYLPMNIREFAFRMINNTNALNARINHRDDSVDDYCSYCTIDNEFSSNRETLEHFYGNCETISNFTKDILNNKFSISNYTSDWNLLGVPTTFNNTLSAILNIELILINMFLYKYRRHRSKPTITEYNKYYSLTRMILFRSKFYKNNYDKMMLQPFDNG